MKMAIQRETDEFLIITLKHVSSLTVILYLPRTQDYGQSLMNMAIKRENNEFLVINLKHVLGLTVVVNRPRPTKLGLITHEHGHKARKRRFFCHKSQTCIGSYGRCKSP